MVSNLPSNFVPRPLFPFFAPPQIKTENRSGNETSYRPRGLQPWIFVDVILISLKSCLIPRFLNWYRWDHLQALTKILQVWLLFKFRLRRDWMLMKIYCKQWESDDRQWLNDFHKCVGNTVAIAKFCEQVCGDSEIRYLLAFVRNESHQCSCRKL